MTDKSCNPAKNTGIIKKTLSRLQRKKGLINRKIVTVYLFEIKTYKVRQKSFKDFTIIDVIAEAKYTTWSVQGWGETVI